MNYRHAFASLAAVLLLAGAPGVSYAQRPSEPVTLNFVNADIEAVARAMAAITGRNIVVDPRVKGTMTLATERAVPPQQAFNQFVATLRLSGFTVVESGGLLKVVPEAEAKLQGGAVTVDGSLAGNQIATQIFRLSHENASNLVPILRPLISPNNTINVNPGNNSLVITDYADNLRRIGRIVAALDVPNATDVEVINLQHALAVDIAPIVQRLADTGGGPVAPAAPGQGQADTSFRTTVIAEPRSNSLIVRAANPARLNLVRSVVARLDVPGTASTPAGNIHVVYLRNADATKLASILRAAIASSSISSTGGGAASGGPVTAPPGVTSGLSGAGAGTGTSAANAPIAPSAQPSTGGQVQADPATNSLIITRRSRSTAAARRDRPARRPARAGAGGEPHHRGQRRQGGRVRIQWQNIIGNQNSSVIGFLGSNFSPSWPAPTSSTWRWPGAPAAA